MVVRTTEVNYYTTSFKRASDASVGATDALARSDSYTVGGTIQTISDIDGVSFTGRKSSTFFVGAQGDEKADYSYNYANDGKVIKTISVNYYTTSFKSEERRLGKESKSLWPPDP